MNNQDDKSASAGAGPAPSPAQKFARCKFCDEEIRLDWADGDWEDRETHTTCAAGQNADKPHEPRKPAMEDRVTAVVREADRTFERVGGSSRHWVRDCFLPLLEEQGLEVAEALAGRPAALPDRWQRLDELSKRILAGNPTDIIGRELADGIQQLLVLAGRPAAPPQSLTNDEAIVIREAVRALDCGAHYCRYCDAKSPNWAHSEHCPYERSLTIAEQARAILDRIQLAAAAPAAPPAKDV